MANAVLLAGHVQVGEGTFFGGGAAVHQFGRIGEGAMTGGLARVKRAPLPLACSLKRRAISVVMPV